MNRESLLEELAQLPETAQQQVVDFIAFLRSRYALEQPVLSPQVGELANEPFVGMWRDREDVQDSTDWVRKIRRSEWQQD